MTAATDDPMQGDIRGRVWRVLLLDVGPVVLLAMVFSLTRQFDRQRADELVLLLVILPLLARRRWPLYVMAVVASGAVLTTAGSGAPYAQIGAIAVASFTVGDLAIDRARSALSIVVAAGLMSLAFIVQDADPLEALVLTFVVVVPAWLLGDVARARRVEAARHAEDIERSLREREERLRAAAAEERRHVARELHDVVAHAVSVMVIQAGAARQVLHTSPGQAEEAMLAVESTGREAMTELRRFLGALSAEDEAAGVAPQPGIGELSALLERVREAGLPASLEIDGQPRPVQPSLDVTVFRIVQEGLTNALRYAGRAATLVRLSWEPEQLRVEILDDGPAAASSAGSGRGLVGMRERATLAGGRLEAGPRIGGGYAVRAWLPLEMGPPTAPGTA